MPHSSPVASPTRSHPAPASTERRTTGRQRRRLKIAWRPLGGPENVRAGGAVRDISRSGIAIFLNEEVKPGAILFLLLEHVPGAFAEPRLVRVRHVTLLNNGEWLIGCSFSRRFSE